MEGCDFIEWLGADMCVKILMCLENPSDLACVSTVSSSWRKFVIANGISKQLCVKMFPEISTVAHAIGTRNMIEPVEFRPEESMEWTCLNREHKVFAFLARGLASFMRKDCISGAISASSTDNYPEESIDNTLEPGDRIGQRVSYWSSKGEKDPAVPEKLTYTLTSKLCVITEIHIQPFQAKALRFSVGHPKVQTEVGSVRDKSSASQESFSENVAHVEVVGRPLSSAFDVEILDETGKCTLKYYPEKHCLSFNNWPQGEPSSPSRFHRFSASIRGWEQMILNTLLGAGAVVVDHDDDSDGE